MNAVLDASSVPDSPAVPNSSESPRADRPTVPEWFGRSRRDAWQTYTALPAPSRRDEDWRFADLGSLQFDDYRRQPAAEPGVAALLSTPATRLVFSNDVLVAGSPADADADVLTLRAALERHGDRLAEVLVSPDTGLGGAKFAALHQSQLLDAVVVVVPDGKEIAHPIEIVHWVTGDRGAAFPRTIVLAGERSKVTVLEHHLAPDGTTAVSCGAAQLVAQAGSQIHYSLLNELPVGVQSLHFSTVRCARDASVKHALVNLGDGRVRTECLSHVTGEGGRSDMLSVSVPRGRQEIDQRTLQHHAAPHTFSDLLYKNILSDAGRSIFAGLIRVDEGAHFTDAYQKCRNLLLSDDSEANSMPGLEINADNVKCSHGATCGRIDSEQVFYFASRGIPEVQAAQLIATGFAAEAIEAIEHPEVRELLHSRLEARFAQLAALPAVGQGDIA